MVNFGPLAAETDPVVWGTPQISTAFASWQRYSTVSSSGRQPNVAALNRGRHLRSAGRPSRWALAHILVMVYYGRPYLMVSSSFFFFHFFLAYSQRSQIGCLPYFHTWCGLSANLECRTEMCCTRLAENTGRKTSPSAHHRTTFRPTSVVAKRLDGSRCHLVRRYRTALLDYIFATKACTYRQSEKNWLNSNMSSTCPHNMVNFSPLTAEIGWRVWNIH